MGDGVYLVGHPEPPALAREYAALLLGGPAAALGLWTAGALWDAKLHPPDGKVHLLLSAQRRDTGTIAFHRTRVLDEEIDVIHGDMRVTTPARTVADLARHLDDRALEQLIADLVRRGLLSERDLVPYTRDRPGAVALRRVLQVDGGAQWTRSRAEQEFLKIARRAGLPAPRMNKRRGHRGRDAVFDEAKVIVEIDGFAFHGDRYAFEADRRRDAERASQGWLTIRVTWRRLRDAPMSVAGELSATLALRTATSRSS